MRSNGLLKWLLLPVLALAVFVGVRFFSRAPETGTTLRPVEPSDQLTPIESKSLGVAGDTPRDTVATLVGQVKELRKEVDAVAKENKQHKAENQRLRQNERAIDQRIQSALATERERLSKEREQATTDQERTRNALEDLQRKLDGVGGKVAPGGTELPVGLGLRDDEDVAPPTKSLQWIEPDDALPTSERKGAAPRRTSARDDVSSARSSFAAAGERVQAAAEDTADAVGRLTPVSALAARPVYTVPDNATLTGSVAMTALIGRIPIDGTVHDAYPFKVLIGSDNLAANGIEIPDVAGAIASGTASGDWTLSCVRGQIRSLTFVFNDGTVRTITDASASGRSATRATDAGLGWISDPYGIPCVSGERHSNAQQYLTSQALITAAGAGAASLIKSDRGSASFVTGRDGNVVGTVGISGDEAMGRILAGGVQQMSEWVNRLYGQAFAAIYVRPGADVAVHIEQPLAIDYEPHGRRVNHHAGVFDAPDLD